MDCDSEHINSQLYYIKMINKATDWAGDDVERERSSVWWSAWEEGGERSDALIACYWQEQRGTEEKNFLLYKKAFYLREKHSTAEEK